MPRILILTRDKAYGKYLQNLADQLSPELESKLGNPDRPVPGNWKPELIVLDQDDSFEQLREKSGRNREVPFIVLSERGERDGGLPGGQVLPKPLEAGRFVQALYDYTGDALGRQNHLKGDPGRLETFAMGSSPAMKDIRKNILQISDTALPVLIQGETGTGKGVVARLLHSFSSREPERYLEINCANLPPNLMESELFGHRQGAFTGAFHNKVGRFQMASGGTVFLDEISELSSYMQAKLLHVLQDGEFAPVGSTDNIKVDVRILAASNADLTELISLTRFRKDLYYRLAVISLFLPPLRDRREDVEILATHFLEKYCRLYEKKSIRMTGRLRKMFAAYHWPGNVRELENMVKTLVALENEEEVIEDLQNRTGECSSDEKDDFAMAPGEDGQWPGLKEITDSAVARAEKEVIAQALSRAGGNKKLAAGLLRVSYKSLLNKIKSYGLN